MRSTYSSCNQWGINLPKDVHVSVNLPVFTAASMEYVEEFILKGLNIRLLTKSAKRMPDNVDTTYEPTMYIYSLSQTRFNTGEKDNIPGCCTAILREARLKVANFGDSSSHRPHCHLACTTGRG